MHPVCEFEFLILSDFIPNITGNDGPLWGSILSPADQMDVLSVGGFGGEGRVAPFSSRGMTTSDLISGGMGRVKPDLLAPSVNLYSSSGTEPYGCVTLTGTSVATPVVTGAVAVLLSYAFEPVKYVNSTILESLGEGKGNATLGNRGNSSHAETVTETVIYDRKSPKFLRLKNIAAVKQIILSSSKPSPVPGQRSLLHIYINISINISISLYTSSLSPSVSLFVSLSLLYFILFYFCSHFSLPLM